MPKAKALRRTATQRKECKTCQHPKRATIDKVLAKGKSVRAVAKAYGLTEASVRRHVKHIQAVVTAAQGQRERRRRLAMVSLEEQYARDGRQLDNWIAKAKDVTEQQRWFSLKLDWYALGLKWTFLAATLRKPPRSGGSAAAEKEHLPEAVQRVIDAVVNDG